MINSSILNLKNFKLSAICAFFYTRSVGFQLQLFAQETAPKGAEKPFEPKSVILEHIGDSHMWPVAIPPGTRNLSSRSR